MKLSQEVKDLIKKEYDEFKEQMYAGKSKEERDELAQFFTPPEISIKLIEELTDLSGNVLDPTSGSGNLLAAALIAGADTDKIFGNDFDATMVKLCRDRLNNVCDMLGKPHIYDWQIHQGNALQARCLIDFSEEYSGKRDSSGHMLPRYNPDYINDLDYAQTYDHEETIEVDNGMFGKSTEVKKYKAMSWRWENEQAKMRAEAKAKVEEKKKQKVTIETVSLF